MKIRALIVDDEAPARERLRGLLAAHDWVEIVGEAQDGEHALALVEELSPDVLFLDIQMPGCSGLEVAASLSSGTPRVIFCTAFDEHAVDAFELDAADYLLKPVSRARLDKALARLRDGATGDQARPAGVLSRFLGKRANRWHVVPRDRVLFFSSEEGMTRLDTADLHYWMQAPLAELAGRLDADRFFQISRNAIVNLDAVKELVPLPEEVADVVMSNGTRLRVSRRRVRALMERLSGER
ncbi:MAG: response regulator transcription factor [Acidobacteriota bacterium]|nr:response regulator transcription factor [Acidobacteriota bacterium]